MSASASSRLSARKADAPATAGSPCEADLVFIPLEDQDAARDQDAEAFAESGTEVFSPCIRIETTVLFLHPAALASTFQVWRVEHDQPERTVRERHVPEVADDVGLHDDPPTVAQGFVQFAVIHVNRVRMRLVEPELLNVPSPIW